MLIGAFLGGAIGFMVAGPNGVMKGARIGTMIAFADDDGGSSDGGSSDGGSFDGGSFDGGSFDGGGFDGFDLFS